MSPAVRPARRADAGAIARILSQWIDETPWMPRVHSHEEDRTFGAFLIDKTDVLVADGPVLRGFIACRGEMIDALYVSHAHRGTGVGSALLERARAGRARMELWTFQANTPAREFYARQGFVEDEMTDGAGNDEGLPDVHMTWLRRPER